MTLEIPWTRPSRLSTWKEEEQLPGCQLGLYQVRVPVPFLRRPTSINVQHNVLLSRVISEDPWDWFAGRIDHQVLSVLSLGGGTAGIRPCGTRGPSSHHAHGLM
jgi:hypothetical protein